jgi:hypothetical protein
MSAISPCYAVAGLLVCHKAVIESADKLETSDSGRTRKKPNERQKIMGRARCWRISKTQCRGDETGRGCVQKKEETDIGRQVENCLARLIGLVPNDKSFDASLSHRIDWRF